MEERETPDAAPGASTSGETPRTWSSGRDQWGGGGGRLARLRVPGSTAGALLRLGATVGSGPGGWHSGHLVLGGLFGKWEPGCWGEGRRSKSAGELGLTRHTLGSFSI